MSDRVEVKFKSEIDRELFEREAMGEGLSLEEKFLKRRQLEIGLADWERRNAQQQNWREKRWKYMQGIKKFHRSTKGKEFHRRLGRFLATRDVVGKLSYYQSLRDRERFGESYRFDKVEEWREFLIAVSSVLTHALIEERYYEPDLQEAVSYKLFLQLVVEKVVDTIEKIVTGREEEVDWEFWREVVSDFMSSQDNQKDSEKLSL